MKEECIPGKIKVGNAYFRKRKMGVRNSFFSLERDFGTFPEKSVKFSKHFPVRLKIKMKISQYRMLAAGLGGVLLLAGISSRFNIPENSVSSLPRFTAEAAAQDESAAPLRQERIAFDELLEEWKTILQKMLDLRLEYRASETPDARRQECLREFNQLRGEAQGLNQQLMDQAIVCILKYPRENMDLDAFILNVLREYRRIDLHDEALAICKKLLSQDIKSDEITETMAYSALYANDFETAAKYGPKLKDLQWRRKSDFDYSQSQFGKNLEYWQAEWKREQELRRQEEFAGDLPRVILNTTRGEIEIELFENEAPNTVANFIFLVEKGFYSNLDFHRVIHHEMAQGGGSELLRTETNLDGTLAKRQNKDAGPGYTIPDELGPNARKHFRGSVSMANAGPNTGGSQFFICYQPRREYDGKHTVFGRVVRGMDVVSFFLERQPYDPNEELEDEMELEKRVLEVPGCEMPDKILSAKVVRKRRHPYSPYGIMPCRNQKPPWPKMPGEEDKPGIGLSDNWDPNEEIRLGTP